jgi:hypothetical protein
MTPLTEGVGSPKEQIAGGDVVGWNCVRPGLKGRSVEYSCP